MKRHADVLLFQMGNWLSGFVWFSVFLHLSSPLLFAPIAGAELMFGFFGVFITNLSLRLHADGATQARELRLLTLRLGALILVAGAALLGVGSLAGVLAMAGIALTPAHLPLLLKHQPWLLTPLLARLPLALAAYFSASLPASTEMLAVLYFVPGILYGLFAYQHYFRKLPERHTAPSPVGTRATELLGQLLATAAASLIQARIVAALVVAQPGLALVERLLRSAHSFAYPHLLRRGLLCPRLRTLLGAICVCGVAGVSLFEVPAGSGVNVALPTLLDAYSTIAAGWRLPVDLLFIAAAGLFLAQP